MTSTESVNLEKEEGYRLGREMRTNGVGRRASRGQRKGKKGGEAQDATIHATTPQIDCRIGRRSAAARQSRGADGSAFPPLAFRLCGHLPLSIRPASCDRARSSHPRPGQRLFLIHI